LKASDISSEEWADFLGVFSQRHKVYCHAKHKPLYLPKEHVYVYLSALRGLVNKRYAATKG
jgi:hypothetical protein